MTGATREELKELVAEVVKTESDYQRVPKWFIRFVTGVAMALLPWGVWVTHTLMKIDATATVRTNDVVYVKGQLDAHLHDKDIHHTAIQRIQVRLEFSERRLEKLEERMRKLP